MITSSDILAKARDFLGVRWMHQGRSIHGIDCAGLVVRVHQDLGLPIEDIRGYRRAPNGHMFLDHIRNWTSLQSQPLPGTIGIFSEVTFACHVGFFGEQEGKTTLVHASLLAGKVVEEVFDESLQRKLLELRGVKGVAY